MVNAADMPGQRQPVLVELFTSEGCSSCPPADALLAKMDREQPIPGAEIIVLSEHVDYWNRLGWADPYSSQAFSERQQTYARGFGINGPYTPQMVVDGSTEFVGSDGQKAAQAIRSALRETRVGVRLRAAQGDNSSVSVEVDPFPAGKNRKANVYVARAMDSGTSDVLRGENQGRRLQHVSIVKDIQQVGSISQHAGLEKQVPVSAGSRLIVFVQEGGSGRVWGAAMYSKP
jgi:hypothetical protein